MKINDIVYHVAHPGVSGVVVGPAEGPSYVPGSEWIPVKFSTDVGFTGNKSVGLRTYWYCSSHLLFKTSKQARANHLEL